MSKGKRAKPRPGWEIVKAFIPVIVVVVTSLITLSGYIYQNYIVGPKVSIRSHEGRDYLSVQEEYRQVKACLRPQVVVNYRGHALASAYLKGFYESEHVTLLGKEGVAIQTDPGMTGELLFYIRQSILDSLVETCGEDAVQESDLDVHISRLGGVTYSNNRGTGGKEFCFIEVEGSILDYDRGRWVISARLNEYEIELPADVESMEQDKQVEELIQDVSAYIAENLLGKTEKGVGVFRRIVVITVIIAAVAVIYELYLWRRRIASELKKRFPRLYRHAPVFRLALIVAVVCITPQLTILAAQAVAPTRDERLAYHDLGGRQKPESVLFTPEQPKEPEPSAEPSVEPEPWPAQAVMNRLHIPAKFVGLGINQTVLDYYDGLFEEICRNGTNGKPEEVILPGWFDLENEPYASLKKAMEMLPEEKWPDTAYGKIEAEVNKWPISRRPAALYHVGQELAEVVLYHPELGFEELFVIAADGVAINEQFLTYWNRNIENADKDIQDGEDFDLEANNIRNAEDIALENGKVYWMLANDVEELETSEEYDQYVPCLWAAGYKCMEKGRERVREDDPEYAKMTYYLGGFGERMLPYISQETHGELYDSIGTGALRDYYEAQELLKDKTKSYRVEREMADHIQSGINTLEGMGFVYEPEAQ